ncbi:large-conductance mechanosensitive channel [Candidatus Phycosocius bacilliformis]|uniref:Large-conductance mechanosensitive channel n=1 Tax=Candidatus Phycosocius bacilliformis TaxID=1445552 RepID=A0A2P2EA15_9PROT|nr:large-conductance mechanosensitive channel protein MscL [Candidatus Phycosocius bacilliformis]GBF57902.1 large-conductance mechanosensitive channel [Candidatus Phycosocius bacilliformis]
MSIAQEFKAFISGGNVVDLAVGVVIGASFGKIVTAVVDKLIMPVVGLLTGGVDLSGMKIVLQAADEASKKAEVAIGYGDVLAASLNFVIVGFVLFMVVKAYNKVRTPAAPAAPAGPSQEELLAEIRDLLKQAR